MAQKTKKFSQFVVGSNLEEGDIIVGLRDGDNHKFTWTSTNAGAVTLEVEQSSHGLSVTDIIRRDAGSYVLAQADDLDNSQAIGMIIEVVDADNFIVQHSGFIDGLLSGLNDGDLLYLDPNNAGKMINTKPTGTSEVVKPIFVATASDSGWLLNQISLSTQVFNSTANVEEDISQSNSFTHGDVIYFDGLNFEKAISDSKERAEVFGLAVNPTSSTFDIHLFGKVDLTGSNYVPLNPGQVYFLSDVTEGLLTPIEPTTTGYISKALLIARTENIGYFHNWRGIEIGSSSSGGGGSGDDFPVSYVTMFASTTLPSGYLECDGSAVSRTTYNDLFASIGTTFGAGDGSTTFNLPDLRGQFVRGWDDGRGIDSGRSFGSDQDFALDEVTGVANNIPWSQQSYTNTGVFDPNPSVFTHTSNSTGTGNTRIEFDASNVARTDSETRPINQTMVYAIKT